MKKLILFDLDGTIIDTKKDISDAVLYMLREMGRDPATDEEIANYVGKGLYKLIVLSLGTEEKKLVEKGSKIYRKYYSEHLLDNTKLFPGAKEILEYFKNRKQAVITNKPNPFTSEIIKALGVYNYFEDVLTGENGFLKKPDPKSVFFLIEKYKVLKEEVLFIGDSLIDIETGKNSGVKTVILTHGFCSEDTISKADPDFVVPDCKELLNLIKEKNW